MLVVEVVVELQQVRFDLQLLTVEGRSHTDVGDGRKAGRDDPRLRHVNTGSQQDVVLRVDVGRRAVELAAAAVAADDLAGDAVGAAEHPLCRSHLARIQGAADGAGGDRGPVELDS